MFRVRDFARRAATGLAGFLKRTELTAESAPADAGNDASADRSSSRSRRRERLAVLGLLGLLLAVAYGDVIFRGRSLVYSDNYNPLDPRVLPENHGADPIPAETWSRANLRQSANVNDPGATWWQWEPGGEFLRRALRRGEWPWWDPYVGAGAPAMANLTQSFFFPPYTALVALGNGSWLKNLYFLGLLLLASWASYALLRRHGLSREGSLFGAVAVLFCGGLVQNAGSFIGQTAALLPPTLWLTRWFLERPSWRRTGVLATGYAAVALASFPPLLLAAFGLAAAYAGLLILAAGGRGRRLRRYALGAGLGLAMVAFCYLPAFTAQRDLPQVARAYAGAGLESVRWETLSQLLSPVLMGGGMVYASPPMGEIGLFHVPYVGIVVLALASLAGSPRRRDGKVLFTALAAMGAFSVFKLMGLQPFQSAGRLPVLNHVHFANYFGIPLGCVLCYLGAFGFDRLLRGDVGARRWWVVASGWVGAALAMPFLARARGALAHPRAADWIERWLLLLVTLLLALGLIAVYRRRTGTRERWRRLLLVAGCLALLGFEGLANNWYPRQRRWDVWRHPPPYVEQLVAHRGLGRIFSAIAFPANAGSAFELYGLDSLMTFNSRRIFELYRRYAAPRAYLFLREAESLPPEPVLDAANIGLFALRQGPQGWIDQAERRGYERLWDDGHTWIFRRETEPRYYFSSEYRVLDESVALAAVGETRPARLLLLEEPPPFPPSVNRADDPPVVAEVSRNRVRLSFDAPRAGLLYCSETDFPGWHATVNGVPATILAANYAFRAIPVPAGPVVVELGYLPPGLPLGLALSSLGLLAAAVLMVSRDGSAPAALSWRPRRPRSGRWRLLTWTLAGGVLVISAAVEARKGIHFAPPRALAPAQPPRSRPAAFYRVGWGGVDVPSHLGGGETARVVIKLRNDGSETWPALGRGDDAARPGAGAVRLSWRWWQGDAESLVTDYQARVDLPKPLRPGEAIELSVAVRLPIAPGNYRLQVDLVHELVAWFESRGAPRLLAPVTVESR